jgi:hypothetical protein
LRVALRLTRVDSVPVVEATLDLPSSRFAEVAAALAGVAAGRAASLGAPLGCVAVRQGEEPSLTAIAARRDLVGERMLRDLMAGEAHRVPTLWLVLNKGTFLAEVIDPYATFAGTHAAIAGLVGAGRAVAALRVETVHGPAASEIRIRAYGPCRVVLGWLRAARAELRRLPGWESARAAAATAPRTTVKTRFQR